MALVLASLKKRQELAKVIMQKLQVSNPDPRCELIYKTPYQLLVSVALSAQTTDMMVNRVMAPLYEDIFTPETVVALGAEGFLAKIRSIGLAPTKAKNVAKMSQILIDQFDGNIPRSREDLESLPGVGRKTANVILGEIYREPTLAVDTHVFRVSRRLGLQDEKTPEKAELELLKVVDPKDLPDGHHHFILHGRYICKALSPQCDNCALNDICPSYEDLRAKPEDKKPAVKKAAAKKKTATKKVAAKDIRISDIKVPGAKKKSATKKSKTKTKK